MEKTLVAQILNVDIESLERVLIYLILQNMIQKNTSLVMILLS